MNTLTHRATQSCCNTDVMYAPHLLQFTGRHRNNQHIRTTKHRNFDIDRYKPNTCHVHDIGYAAAGKSASCRPSKIVEGITAQAMTP